VRQGWALEPHHELLLQQAAHCLERAADARELIARDGILLETARGTMRPHPMCCRERDAVLMFSKLLAQLKLDGDARTTPPLPGARSHKKGPHLYVTS
jgi:hypothetical protein